MIGEITAHIWQSTVFAVAAGLLTLAFRKNRAKVRYWLWLGASVKFLVPFAVLLALGNSLASHSDWTPAARKIATPAVSAAVQYIAEPFTVDVAPVVPVVVSSRNMDWIGIAIPSVWVCGLLAMVFIRLRLWQRIRAALRHSVCLDIPAKVPIRSAPGLLEPGVVGLIRPVLLLPEGIADRLTPAQLEAVIAHELCHVRRRDNLFASLHMVVEGLFWFHPLVWWIGARMVEERERACDEEVLYLGNEPRVYADAILDVCKLYAESPLVCVSGVTGSDIKRRIEAIMMNRRLQGLNRAKKALLAAAGVVTLAGPVAVGVLIGVGHVPVIRAQSPIAIPWLPQVAQVVPATPQAGPARGAAQTAAAPVAAPLTAPAAQDQDRRLVVMLFDFGGMRPEEQARIRQVGVDYIHSGMKPTDLVSVLVAGAGVSVEQDFTSDPVRLEAVVQKINAPTGSPNGSDLDAKLANIETVSKLLGRIAGKKAVMYFSNGVTQAGADNQAVLMSVINVAKQSNVAIYPIDARGLMAPTNDAAGAGGGRGGQVPVAVGVSQEENARRTAYAQANFNDPGRGGINPMGRTYIAYGPPDQIDDRSSNTQNPSTIWRYNYLENFHSSVEFEFPQRKSGGINKRINYPPAATHTNSPNPLVAGVGPLFDELRRELAGRSGGPAPANDFTTLPEPHLSVGVYPAGEASTVTVPLGSLSGQIEILGQVRTNAGPGAQGTVVGNVRDGVTFQGTGGPSAKYQTEFTLAAGSYLFSAVVEERSTGRMFGETIPFDVK